MNTEHLTADEMKYWNCELFQIGRMELRRQREHQALTTRQIAVARAIKEGQDMEMAARSIRTTTSSVKQTLHRIYGKLGLKDDGRLSPRVRLAIYLNCELFQVGLKELDLVQDSWA